MNLVFMNNIKFLFFTIIIICCLGTTNAQDIDRFVKQYNVLLDANKHSEVIQLLENNKRLFRSNAELFLFNIMKANSFISMENIEQGKQSLSKATQYYESLSVDIIKSLENHNGLNLFVAKYYWFMGELYFLQEDLGKTETFYSKCYRVLFARKDHEQLGIFRDLHYSLGLLFMRMYDYPRAKRYFKDGIVGSQANLWFDKTYCLLTTMLGNLSMNDGEYLTAKIHFDEAEYTLSEYLNDDTSIESYTIRSMLSACYTEMGYFDDAKRIALEGIANCKRNGLSDRILSQMYQALGYANLFLKDFHSAKSIFRKAYELSRKDNRISDKEKQTMLSNLALSQYLINDEKCIPTILSLSKGIIEDVVSLFSFMSSEERARYWDKTSDELAKYNSMLFELNKENSLGQIYDNTLFSKGLLLRYSNHLSKLVSSLSDDNVYEKTMLLQELNKRLINEELNNEALVSVKNSIRSIEKELSAKIAGYQSVDEIRKQYSWRNIKHSLKEGEAAIEFIQLPDLTFKAEKRIEYYGAIIITKDSKNPKIIKLCQEDSLSFLNKVPHEIESARLTSDLQNQLFRQYLYGNGEYVHKRVGKKAIKFDCIGEKLYSLIWEPLENELRGVNRIYYSPSGILNSIAFGAISHNKASLSSKYELHLLSSTSEISKFSKISKLESAIVYGGINYDTDKDEMLVQARGYNKITEKSKFDNNRGYNERGAWGPLPGTYIEAQEISLKLHANEISIKLLDGAKANEESFKALSGKSPSLIHIATHGFFYPDNKKIEMLNFLEGIKGLENLNHIQSTMTRSGILFSGANKAWQGDFPEANIEDGILTAEEISHLDLSNTEIVVLSACETGLGDVISTEGVFGLQRALKLAGVNSIIMSLWKVDDNATTEFMKLFYEKWLTGTNSREAFSYAQKQIRERKEFASPYFWAGFVMLD